MPDKYLLDRNYHLVKADVDNKIKFVGPKGVGKSSALLTIWSEALISGKSCILIGMETLSGYNTTEVSQYFSTLFDCAAVHSPRTLINCVIDYVEEKNSLLFIDLTYMRSSEQNVKELTRLLLCNSPSIAIALSSGGDRDFEQNYIASIVDVRLQSFKAIYFKPFNEQEATAFIETFTIDMPP